jgi:hypothetical protein
MWSLTLLLSITWVSSFEMDNASPFWIFTLWDLFNSPKDPQFEPIYYFLFCPKNKTLLISIAQSGKTTWECWDLFSWHTGESLFEFLNIFLTHSPSHALTLVTTLKLPSCNNIVVQIINLIMEANKNSLYKSILFIHLHGIQFTLTHLNDHNIIANISTTTLANLIILVLWQF